MLENDKDSGEERAESLYNFVNCFVENSNFLSNELPFGDGIIRECEINKTACIHIHIRLCGIEEMNTADICLVIEGPHSDIETHIAASCRDVDSTRCTKDNMKQTMFIVIRESMEDPEGMLHRVCASMRLQRVDNCFSGIREGSNFPFAVASIRSAIGENGEFCRGGRLRNGEQGQLPSEMIECRPELSQRFPNQDPNAQRDIFRRLCTEGMGTLLSVEIGNDFYRITTKKRVDLAIQRIIMLSGSDHLRLYARQWMHWLASGKGVSLHDDAKQTKDGERLGDPHPEAGRLLQESEESRHAVSVPPSEEVTSQTAPVHLRDDCTATHTRSNNPEGAS